MQDITDVGFYLSKGSRSSLFGQVSSIRVRSGSFSGAGPGGGAPRREREVLGPAALGERSPHGRGATAPRRPPRKVGKIRVRSDHLPVQASRHPRSRQQSTNLLP
jgi:hypothetical protein